MDREPIKKTSRIAVASLLCVIATLGCVFFFILIPIDYGGFVVAAMRFCYAAAILAIVAIAWITIRYKILKGYIYAIPALVLSMPFLLIDFEISRHVRVRQKHKKEWTGLYNLELLGKEMIRYAEDNNGCLPVAEKWCDSLMEHNENLTRENFKHPQPEIFGDIFDFKGECQFAFNKNLSGIRLADIPGDVVLVFEADGDWNLTGTEELLRTRYKEKGCITILFVNQTTGNYWFYKNAVRKFNPKGTQMYYEEPSWNP